MARIAPGRGRLTSGMGDIQPRCPAELELPGFGLIESKRLLAQDELFVVILDKFPVTTGHALIIARRPVARFQELTGAERARLLVWIDWVEQHLASELKPAPEGFNLGVNDGPAAGQTVPQFHFHVIPRRAGDVPDPGGGVRWVIPDKARYW
jgi:diadenosine tetraphosphate (Ap4A) HIT family hydrolase